MNSKIRNLSETIVKYSLKVKENDRVLITSGNFRTNDLIKELIKQIVEEKGIPLC